MSALHPQLFQSDIVPELFMLSAAHGSRTALVASYIRFYFVSFLYADIFTTSTAAIVLFVRVLLI